MTPEDFAGRIRICMRRLGEKEQPPHSIIDFPAQHRANIEVIQEVFAAAYVEVERLKAEIERLKHATVLSENHTDKS